MKKTFLFTGTLIGLLFISSCSNIIDDAYLKSAQNDYISPYMGKWVGNYMGDGNGSLVLIMNKSGVVEVTRISNNGVQEVFYSNLLGGGSGSLNPSTSPTSQFTLYGSLETKSGTWKQQNWNGTWSVTKQ